MKRGYFAIGVYHAKTPANIGTLWRSAAIFGADLLFTIGRRYPHQASDTIKAWRHIPLMEFVDFDDFFDHLPKQCALVGVEQDERARALGAFVHPERAAYLLGAEDKGLPQDVLCRCRNVIEIPTTNPHCLNVAVAGSILLYDRSTKT